MASGTPFVEEKYSDHLDHLQVLSKSASKIECILKCKITPDCFKAVVKPPSSSKDNGGRGVCYKLTTPDNERLINTESVAGNMKTFSVQSVVPAGNADNAKWRGIC